MKREEVQDSRKRYQKGVSAWGEIHSAIATTFRGNKLTAATRWLDLIGEALACVPGLADAIEEEKDVGVKIREEAAKRGIVLRYD